MQQKINGLPSFTGFSSSLGVTAGFGLLDQKEIFKKYILPSFTGFFKLFRLVVSIRFFRRYFTEFYWVFQVLWGNGWVWSFGPKRKLKILLSFTEYQ